MNERKVMNWCMVFLTILVGVFIMITVVWPQEVLDRVGVVRPLTFGELINAEGLQLTPSQISAFEAGPQFQSVIPGIAGIITQVRGDEGEKMAYEDPTEATAEAARARREGTQASTSGLGVHVTNVPSKTREPTSTREAPKRRPTGEEGPISW